MEVTGWTILSGSGAVVENLCKFLFQSIHRKTVSRVWLFVTPLFVAHQAPLSMEFSRQECWSGLPFPRPGDLPDPGVEPSSLAVQAVSLLLESHIQSLFLNIITF